MRAVVALACLLAASTPGAVASHRHRNHKNPGGAPLRVLFIGEKKALDGVPEAFELLAAAKQRKVVAEAAVAAACSLYGMQPAINTVTRAQLRHRWDYLVLHDEFLIGTVPLARKVYLRPALTAFLNPAVRGNAEVIVALPPPERGGRGAFHTCPDTHPGSTCYGKGDVPAFITPACNEYATPWYAGTKTADCQAYAQLRGTLTAAEEAHAQRLTPWGMAWQAAQGEYGVGKDCKWAVDSQYVDKAGPGVYPLPKVNATVSSNVLYDTPGGAYLKAATLYATMFNETPVGADAAKSKGLARGTRAALLRAAEVVALDRLAPWAP